MGMVVPKERKHLWADALWRSVQDVFGRMPDHLSLSRFMI